MSKSDHRRVLSEDQSHQVGPRLSSVTDGVRDLKRKPVVKTCPSPTNVFTGRKDILKQLHSCFPLSPTSIESAKQRRFVLYGLGGGGKTQVALKFIQECQIETHPQRYESFHPFLRGFDVNIFMQSVSRRSSPSTLAQC